MIMPVSTKVRRTVTKSRLIGVPYSGHNAEEINPFSYRCLAKSKE